MKAVWLCVLMAVTAGPGCGKGSAEVEVVAGAPAGDVTEVAGAVTATRAGQARPLRVGDVVAGDDVVATGADGRVTITLRHNRVPWSLGPGKSKRVADSAAWGAREGANVADVSEDRSGAAGRHAERGAADTVATATDTAPPDRPVGGGPPTGTEPASTAAMTDRRPVAAEPPHTAPKAPKLQPPPSTQRPGTGSGSGSGASGTDVDSWAGVGNQVAAQPTQAVARQMLMAHRDGLKRCYTAALAKQPGLHGQVTIAITVKAAGAVTRVDVTGPDEMATVSSCIHAYLMAARFSAVASDWSASMPMTFASAD